MKHLIPLLLALSIIATLNLQAQTGRLYTAGGLYGFGNTFSDNTKYKVLFTMGDWSKSFSKNPKKKDFVGWYMSPQFNLVKATNTVKNTWDFEYGVNLGIRNYIKISEKLYLYQMLGSGPHYMSAHLDRQANGFIFSDNLAIGSFINFPVFKEHKDVSFLNIQFGIRHISNANLELPNRGINSYNIMLGLSGLWN
jgi:hypothetical protein